MDYNWNWSVFFEAPPGETTSYLYWLITGTSWTVATTLAAFLLAFFIGGVIGTLRTSTVRPVVWLCNLYTEVFRNIPLLVQMFLCFFVLPELLPESLGNYLKQDLPYPSFFSAVAALTLFTSAKLSELFKAGIDSVSQGQRGAALALGMRPTQAYLHVLLPQAIRIVFPPLTSEALNTLKNSSVALTIGLMELTAQARNVAEYSFNTFEAFSAATLIYIVISLIVTFGMARIERSLAISGASR